MENKELEVLHKMDNYLSETSPEVVEITNHNEPIQEVENSLSKFTQDAFNYIREECKFQSEIESEIRRRLTLEEKEGGFTANQMIALLTNNTVNLNDRISKVLAPTFQLMTAKQQAEIAKSNELKNASVTINNGVGSEEMRRLNAQSSQEILQGLTNLNNLLNALSAKKEQIEATSKEE